MEIKVGEGVAGYIKAIEMMGKFSFRDGVYQPVEISPTAKEIKRIAWNKTRMKECFHNAATAVSALHYRGIAAYYVTGFAASVIPLEHAWIAVGPHWYDLTWEKFSDLGKEYVPIYTLAVDQLMEFVLDNHGYAPTPYDIMNITRRRDHG